MNHIGIASDIQYPQSLSDNPKERMVQLIQTMANSGTNTAAMINGSSGSGSGSDPKKLSIQPQSNAARIGKLCLPHILNDILTIINTTTTISHDSSTNNNNNNNTTQETIQEIMQSISQCASSCPTILAADLNLLSMICKTLITIGENGNNGLEPMVRLASCEALVTLCMVPDVRNVMTEQLGLKNLCLIGKESGSIGVGSGDGQRRHVGGIIGICAELLIHGVDEDVDDWAVEDVALQVGTCMINYHVFKC